MDPLLSKAEELSIDHVVLTINRCLVMMSTTLKLGDNDAVIGSPLSMQIVSQGC